MCGIAGFYLKDPKFVQRHNKMEEFADLLVSGIRWRGREATGLLAIGEGGHNVLLEKQPIEADEFVKTRKEMPRGTRTCLLHTRFATQGSVKNPANNHPVVYGSTMSIHNGAIYNDAGLFEANNLERKAEVDSEIISALLSMTGLEKPESALNKLQGAFAIAAVDPIEYPDMLVLAKGAWSPLYVHESDRFLVWASSAYAIEEAWKKVLGTPPKRASFHEFKEGEMWIAKDGDIVRSAFKVDKVARRKKKETNNARANGTFFPSGVPHHHHHVHGEQGNIFERVPTEEASKIERMLETTALREAGKGVARLYMKEAGYSDKEMRDADNPRIWWFCGSCKKSVLKQDFRPTLAWGTICTDCYEVAIGKQPHQNPAAGLTKDERETLESWAALEAEVHRLTLKEISTKTGLDQAAIDWLVFRVPRTYLDRHEKVNNLAANLDDMYQDLSIETWQEFGVDGPDDDVMDLPPEDKEPWPGEKQYESKWANCARHGQTYDPVTEDCPDCIKESKAGDESPTAPKSCVVCKHKTVFEFAGFTWCRKHYETCNYAGGCKGEPVGTTVDGKRFCHLHFRGQKGGRHDTDLKMAGLVLIERRKRDTPDEDTAITRGSEDNRAYGLDRGVTLH